MSDIRTKKSLLEKTTALLAISFVLLTGAAALANAAKADIAALTLEDIVGHQPAYMITKDLTLPEGYTWTAEPTGIIGTDVEGLGKIVRDPQEDKTVTITAQTAGGASKSFLLTVKSKKTNILASDTFAYPYADTVNALDKPDFIFDDMETNPDGIINPVIKENGNSYFKIDWTHAEEGQQIYLPDASVEAINAAADIINVSFRFKWEPAAAGAVTPEFNLFMGDSSCKRYKKVRLMNVGFDSAAKTIVTAGYDLAYQSDSNENMEWNSVKLRITKSTGEIEMQFNGKWSTADPGIIYHTTDKKNYAANRLISFYFERGNSSRSAGTLLLDDFVVYSEETYPVTIKVTGDETNPFLTAAGATEGGVLFIAKLKEDGSFESARLVKDSFDNIAIGSPWYQLFFFNNEEDLRPLAESKRSVNER